MKIEWEDGIKDGGSGIFVHYQEEANLLVERVISTGFSDIDDLTSGLQRSDLIVIAGRPSMGKTSLAMNIVESTVLDNEITL